MKHESKLSQEQQHEIIQHSQQQAGHEFADADALLRFDAEHTIVPPELTQRLQQSSANIPPSRRSWWKNLFGG